MRPSWLSDELLLWRKITLASALCNFQDSTVDFIVASSHLQPTPTPRQYIAQSLPWYMKTFWDLKSMHFGSQYLFCWILYMKRLFKLFPDFHFTFEIVPHKWPPDWLWFLWEHSVIYSASTNHKQIHPTLFNVTTHWLSLACASYYFTWNQIMVCTSSV
jgi:hypothetical protein